MSYPLSAGRKVPSCLALSHCVSRALFALFLCLFALSLGLRTQAATIEVDAGVAGGDCCAFQTISNVPGVGTNNTTMNVGDTVHWVWKTDAHSVTSSSDEWADAGVHNTGFTFDHTFNAVGSFDYYCIIHGDFGMVGTITVVAPATSVTGNLALEGVPDLSAIDTHAPLGTFEVAFRTPGTLPALFSANVTLTPVGSGSPFGTFRIGSVPAGTYDIAIKGGKNLRVVKQNMNVSGTTVLTDTLLIAGDTNNDNRVDVGDFGVVVNAYGGAASDPGSNYDPQADFNFDGTIDVGDFGMLVNSYDLSGDP